MNAPSLALVCDQCPYSKEFSFKNVPFCLSNEARNTVPRQPGGLNYNGSQGFTPFVSAIGSRDISYNLGYNINSGNFGYGANIGGFTEFVYPKQNHISPEQITNKSIEKGRQRFAIGKINRLMDGATSPFLGLGLKGIEDFGDDLFRGLGNGGRTFNKFYGPAANIWGGYNMFRTANDPTISNPRMVYDLAKNGIPIGIDVAIMFGLLESTPTGWIGTGVGVIMEGSELYYDKVHTPVMNYLLDYSNRWDQWYINRLIP